MKRIKARMRGYIERYDARPFVTSVLGMGGIFLAAIAGAYLFFVLPQAAGIDPLIMMMLSAPYWLLFMVVVNMVLGLTAEWMWRFFGIYSLLGIKGRPIRNGVSKWCGV